MQSIKNIRLKLDDFLLVIKGTFALITQGHFAWQIRFTQSRYKYNLNALRNGIKNNLNGLENLGNFRRNIHRLEKGMLYKERKEVFAEDYIRETIDYLVRIKSSPTCDKNTVIWGEAVLNQYFNAFRHSKTVAAAYEQFKALKSENLRPMWRPYFAGQRPDSLIDFESLYNLALKRRSVRFYLDKNVEFAVVERAMKIAALSPSACNRQSFKFLFYNDNEVVDSISQIPGGCAGYKVPSIIVVVGTYRDYFDERDVNVPIIDASLAVMSFLLALETLGLSSVCLNMPSLPDRDEALRRIIRLEDDEIVVMMIGIGYPDPNGKIAFSAKRDIPNLVRCNDGIIAETLTNNT